jgi:hypothetical protein
MLLMKAYDQPYSVSADQVRSALSAMSPYPGIVGEIYVDEGGIFHSTGVIKKITNGKRITVEE